MIIFLLFIAILPAQSQGCENLDLSMGNFTNWKGGVGKCCPIDISSFDVIYEGRHTVMRDVDATDPKTGDLLKFIPSGYKYSARLGNSDVGAEAESLSYTLTVDDDNALLIYKFAVVFEDPGHDSIIQPSFQIRVKDQNDQAIDACVEYRVIASASISGFNSYTWQDQFGDHYVRWRDWTTVGLNLLPYKGQTVTIELITSDCGQDGHFGYAYFVAQCSPMELIATYCPGSAVATLIAPEGFEKYKWSTGDTVQLLTINNPVEGDIYSCELTSVMGCKATLNAKMQETKAVAGFNYQYRNDCTGTTVFTNKSITNIGTYQFLWDFGDGTTSTEKDPTHMYTSSGYYDVVLKMKTVPSGCTYVTTQKIKVDIVQPPNLKVENDIFVCYGEPVALSATSSRSSAIISWYSNAEYSHQIAQSTTFYVPALRADTVFYVEVTDGDCIVHPRDVVTITVGDSLYIAPSTLPSYGGNRSYYEQQFITNAGNSEFSASGLPPSFVLSSDGKLSKVASVSNSTGAINFTIIVTDKHGCQVSKDYMLEGDLFVPKVFTPNSDGVNDHFMKGYRVMIFDRLGVWLFGGDDGWDGAVKGKSMPSDTYFYIVYYTDDLGKESKMVGYIYLLK